MKNFIISILVLISINGCSQSIDFSNIRLLIDKKQEKQALIALDSLEKATKSDSKSILNYYKAKCYFGLGNFTRSIDLSSTAITECTPKDTLLENLYLLKINSLMQIADFKTAITDNQVVVQLFPNNVTNYVMLSYLYGSISDYENCLKTLDKAIKMDPNNIYILNNLSYYSTMKGDFGRAVDYANTGLGKVKDSMWKGSLLNNRRFAYLYLKQYDKALVDINESINLFPTNSYAYYNKALVCIQTGNSKNICKNLELAKKYGAINMTSELIKKYCEK